MESPNDKTNSVMGGGETIAGFVFVVSLEWAFGPGAASPGRSKPCSIGAGRVPESVTSVVHSSLAPGVPFAFN